MCTKEQKLNITERKIKIMYQFKIEFKSTDNSTSIKKTDYAVESEGFIGMVLVCQYKENQPYVGKHTASKGGEHLWGFQFWNSLQEQVLEFHKNREGN